MTLRHFLRHRKNVDELIARFPSRFGGLTSSRYIRLMIFACVDAFLSLPFNISALAVCALPPNVYYPYRGLADLHYHFSNVGTAPAAVWRSLPVSRFKVILIPATAIGSAFVFFAFFGLNKEARTNYHKAYIAIRNRCGHLVRRFRPWEIRRPK